MTLRIAHLKWQAGKPRGRWACYHDALKDAGHVSSLATNYYLLEHPGCLRGFDIAHVHNAPDGYAVGVMRQILAMRDEERPALVLDIDDDMALHARSGDIDKVRIPEVETCDALLRELVVEHRIPVTVATPHMLDDWPGSTLVRNFPMQDQINAIELWCGGERRRADATVYAGSTSDNPNHHRHRGNWLEQPDAILSGLNRVDLMHALASFRRALIPFRRTPLTDTFEPHKLFEYIVAGCEVVLPGGLLQCQRVLREFADKPVPSFESQLPKIMEVYDVARAARANS